MGMDRRRFIGGSMLLSGAVMSRSLLAGMPAPMACAAPQRPYGVGLYMLREEMSADPVGTIAWLAKAGFKEVELYNFGKEDLAGDNAIFGMSVDAFGELLSSNGIRVPLTHIGAEVTDLDKAAEAAHKLGIERFVEPMAPELLHIDNGKFGLRQVGTLKELDAMCQRINQRARDVTALGLGFGYHNHHIEFGEVEGQNGYAFLTANTDPELVKLEIDLGWVSVAGFDPVAMLEQHLDRVVAVHLKDYNPDAPLPAPSKEIPLPEMARLTTPGNGKSDFRGMLALLDKGNVNHRYVEVDVTPEPLMDTSRGLCFLASL